MKFTAKFAALILIVVLTGNTGCKKKKNGTTAIPKVQTLSYPTQQGTETDTYYYDAQGRVSSIRQEVPTVATHIVNYTYGDNQVTVSSSGLYTTTYQLNSNGFATKSVTQFINPVSVDSNTYTYDADGHRLTAGNVVYTWQNGNQTEMRDTSVTYYSYVTEDNTIGNANMGMTFLGVSSKNLVDTITTSTATHVYRYVFDPNAHVITIDGVYHITYY